MFGFKRKYPSYAAALAASDGYEVSDLVSVIAAKTRVAMTQHELTRWQIESLFSLLVVDGATIRVVDFGGACGASYFLARAILPPSRALEWTVVETDAMVAEARQFENDELRFTTEMPRDQVDMLQCSGSLQYVPDPMGTLRALLEPRPKHVSITRMMLGDGSVTLQRAPLRHNGPGPLPPGFRDREIAYPMTTLRIGEIRAALAGYRIRESWEDGLLASLE